MNIGREIIQKTIKAWQPYADYPLTEKDAREIIEDMRNFAITMIKINQNNSGGKNGKNHCVRH